MDKLYNIANYVVNLALQGYIWMNKHVYGLALLNKNYVIIIANIACSKGISLDLYSVVIRVFDHRW